MSKTLERSLASSSSRRSIKQRSQACILQDVRDVLVPRALPPAAAAVCEHDDRGCAIVEVRSVPRSVRPPASIVTSRFEHRVLLQRRSSLGVCSLAHVCDR